MFRNIPNAYSLENLKKNNYSAKSKFLHEEAKIKRQSKKGKRKKENRTRAKRYEQSPALGCHALPPRGSSAFFAIAEEYTRGIPLRSLCADVSRPEEAWRDMASRSERARAGACLSSVSPGRLAGAFRFREFLFSKKKHIKWRRFEAARATSRTSESQLSEALRSALWYSDDFFVHLFSSIFLFNFFFT